MDHIRKIDCTFSYGPTSVSTDLYLFQIKIKISMIIEITNRAVKGGSELHDIL